MKCSFAMVLLMTCTLPLGAEAQRPNTRSGFWLGFGGGFGSHGLGGDADSVSRETDPAGYIRLGGTLSQKVLLGGEVSAWQQDFFGSMTSVGFIGPIVMYYPSATGSFYLKGGLGLLAFGTGPEETWSGNGFALSLGMGNEFRVGNNLSVVLYVDAVGSTGVELEVFDQRTGVDVNPNIIQFGVGVAWH